MALLSIAAGMAAHADARGERETYAVGCITCHHLTPKEEINAPSLLVVRSYSLADFRKLLRTGHTVGGRDLLKEGSLMGIVAVEQFSHLTDQEIAAIHHFLTHDWNPERIAGEEAKLARLHQPAALP